MFLKESFSDSFYLSESLCFFIALFANRKCDRKTKRNAQKSILWSCLLHIDALSHPQTQALLPVDPYPRALAASRFVVEAKNFGEGPLWWPLWCSCKILSINSCLYLQPSQPFAPSWSSSHGHCDPLAHPRI